MNRFLVEFSFETKLRNVYDFPLSLRVADAREAEDWARRFETGIREQFRLVREEGPCADEAKLGARRQRIEEARRSGTLRVLHVALWGIRDVVARPDKRFDEHVDAVAVDDVDVELALASGEELTLPVVQTHVDPEYSHIPESLFVNVVKPNPIRPDLLVADPAGRPLIAVKADAVGRIDDYLCEGIVLSLRQTNVRVPYVLLVDPDRLVLYPFAEGSLGEPLQVLETRSVLGAYEPEFGRKPIFQTYLTALVDGWLRDLSYHWKSRTPPGAATFEAVGLVSRMTGTRIEPFERWLAERAMAAAS